MDLSGKGTKSVEGEAQLWVNNPLPQGQHARAQEKLLRSFCVVEVPGVLGLV